MQTKSVLQCTGFGKAFVPFCTAGILLATLGSALHAQQSIPGIGEIGEVQLVQDGFQFTEGPAADDSGTVYFTDIPATSIFRINADGSVEKVVADSGHANGLMFDDSGRMLACQMDGRLVAYDPSDFSVTVLAAEYEGERFNAPNDLAIDSDGGVYFTDPLFRAPQPLPQGTMGVYYVAKDGTVSRVAEELPAPNGIGISPDGKTLYVIPSLSSEMLAYTIEGPGKISNRSVFCRLEQPEGQQDSGGDGMCLDEKGNLYITSALGVQVFDPQGKHLGTIRFPQQPANVAFGGPEGNTLYVTARTGVYKCQMPLKGLGRES